MGCMSLTDVRQKVKSLRAILPLPSLLRNSPSKQEEANKFIRRKMKLGWSMPAGNG